MRLYRAVGPDELADISLFGRLFNPPGIDVKYFTLSEAEAVWYARQAVAAFGDPPYTIIETGIGINLTCVATVDQGISVIVLSSNELVGLVPRIVRSNVC